MGRPGAFRTSGLHCWLGLLDPRPIPHPPLCSAWQAVCSAGCASPGAGSVGCWPGAANWRLWQEAGGWMGVGGSMVFLPLLLWLECHLWQLPHFSYDPDSCCGPSFLPVTLVSGLGELPHPCVLPASGSGGFLLLLISELPHCPWLTS